MTSAQLVISVDGYRPSDPGGPPHSITFRGNPVALQAETEFYLSLRHQYRVLERSAHRDWKVSTAEYSYTLEDGDRRRIFGYHWHPGDRSRVHYPHLHIYRDAVSRNSLEIGGLSLDHNALRPDVNDAHFPTHRMTIEGMLLLLCAQFGVRPLRVSANELESFFRDGLRAFEEDRTW